jgi:hypothetical protein
MKFQTLSSILGATALTIASIAPAQAYSWTYGIDSFNDGYNSGVVGTNSAFEFYGMAVAEDANSILFALNANLDLTGNASTRATDGHVGWGDLFLNFTGQNYDPAINSGNMLAIHFAGTNSDSGEQANGLYKVNTAQGVASTNSGFDTLQAHKDRVGAANEAVGNVADYQSYFAMNSTLKNVMLDGDKLGDISFLDAATIASSGLDFASKGAVGSKTIAFSFSKANLPGGLSGDLIATIFAECNNDGMGLVAKVSPTPAPTPNPTDVPEPASVLGLLTIAGSAFGLRRRRA